MSDNQFKNLSHKANNHANEFYEEGIFIKNLTNLPYLDHQQFTTAPNFARNPHLEDEYDWDDISDGENEIHEEPKNNSNINIQATSTTQNSYNYPREKESKMTT